LSTAYKYPLIDAKVFDTEDGRPVVEVPLDGTQYALETGKVHTFRQSVLTAFNSHHGTVMHFSSY